MPSPAGFGVGYITADSMEALNNSPGVANDIVFKFADKYVFDDVKTAIEDALSPFGLKELIDKKDHLSYAFVDQEVKNIRSVASSLPMIFLLMAAVVLYLMMKRVIEQERTQIGVLKAFGYSGGQIVAHYLCYGAVTGIAGGIFGCVLGYYMSEFYFRIFMEFFYMPAISEGMRPYYFVIGMLMAVAGSLLGAFMGTFKIIRLNPAEALRPESPKPVKYDIVGSISLLKYIFTSHGSMALRSMARSPMRSGFVLIGVMFSFGLLTISGNFSGIIDKMMYSRFTYIQLYGVKIPLITPIFYDVAVESAYSIKSVTLAEGLLETHAELKHKHLKENSTLTGIAVDSALYKICDTNSLTTYSPPRDSIILSNIIANKLRAVAGDTILISSSFLDEDVPVVVSKVIEQNMGSGCYMEIGALSALLEIPKIATSVILNTDDLQYLKEFLKNGANISSIDDKDSTLKKLQDMMSTYTSMYYIMEIMAALIGFAIIYNTSAISLSERKREYTTLRVVGLTVEEVSGIMMLEYWVLGLIGMALGVPFVRYLNGAMNAMMETTSFTMPSTLPLGAYFTGVIGSSAAILIAGWSAKRKIRNFDMVEVLKERE
jgi:putative ABC transport system permease protein